VHSLVLLGFERAATDVTAALTPPRLPWGLFHDRRSRSKSRPAVGFGAAILHVRRVKNGTPSTHPLRGDELRALPRLQRETERSPFVFVNERGTPFTRTAFGEPSSAS
jgi:hypothetical protein